VDWDLELVEEGLNFYGLERFNYLNQAVFGLVEHLG
jgi:hypothetical protein